MHELAADSLQPEFRRNEAAVDSELAWLPLSKNNVTLAGPMPNWVYGATNTALLNPTNGILLVARLDGPSAEIARGLVDKALAAERDGLWGRAYFDERGISEPGYKLGDEWISDRGENQPRNRPGNDRGQKPGNVPRRFSDEPDCHLRRLVCRRCRRSVCLAQG